MISIIIFVNCCFHEILNIKGNYSSIWYLSLKSYICVLIVVSINLLIKSNFIVYILPLSIGITTFFLFFIFLILNHYGFLFQFNSTASISSSFSSPLLYLSIYLVTSFSFIFDYTSKLINLFLTNSLSSRLILNKINKSKRKSSTFGISKVNSSKPLNKFLFTKKRNSVQISRNFLFNKLPFLNMQNSTPKQKTGTFLPRYLSSKNMKK